MMGFQAWYNTAKEKHFKLWITQLCGGKISAQIYCKPWRNPNRMTLKYESAKSPLQRINLTTDCLRGDRGGLE